jgi:hypothetical protein
MNKPEHITSADWESMTPRARKRALRAPEPTKVEKTEEEKAATSYNMMLINGGGKYWEKEGEERIYFNNVCIGSNFVGCYYDCIAGEWSHSGRGKAVLDKIAAGIIVGS